MDVDRISHARQLQPAGLGRARHSVVVLSDVPVAGRPRDGNAGAGDGHPPGADVAGRVGAVEHAVGVVGEQNGVGLPPVIQDDALGMGCQQVDQGLGLGPVVGGQGGVAHLHGLICKAVGQPVGPRGGADAVLGHVHPVGQAVEVGAAAQHHGSGGQGAGAAAALLEVKAGVHIQVSGQRPRHTGHQQHNGQQQRSQTAAPSDSCFQVCLILPQGACPPNRLGQAPAGCMGGAAASGLSDKPRFFEFYLY